MNVRFDLIKHLKGFIELIVSETIDLLFIIMPDLKPKKHIHNSRDNSKININIDFKIPKELKLVIQITFYLKSIHYIYIKMLNLSL